MTRAAPLVLLALAAGCSPDPTANRPVESPPPPTPPPVEGMKLVRKLPHSGWSEGIDVHGGELWHAFPGTHRVFDLVTGEELRVYEPPSEYSESLAWVKGELWNVSYSDSNLWVGAPAGDGTFEWRVAGTTPEVHAWGITYDGEHVVTTGNGTERLYFINPATGALVRTIETAIDDLEDLAWDRGAIWASSYSELPAQFFRIDPATGAVLDVFALPEEDQAACQIIDGLAVADGHLYVTGKHCPHVWVYELP